jgi:S-formylglutathione hydrolase FrmB
MKKNLSIRRLNLILALTSLFLLLELPAANHTIAHSKILSRLLRGVVVVDFQSSLLSEFAKHPVSFKAAVLLPPGYAKSGRVYPAVYHIHGFGGDYTEAYQLARVTRKIMRRDPSLAFVHIFLNAACPTGHHGFVDSVNNGPWGTALMREFIPALEKKFRIIPAGYGRFLTGHSSGGWSAVWLKVQYPKEFNGAWATSPDPLDFSSFFAVDIRPGSRDNMYFSPSGKAHPVYRGEPDTVEEAVHVDGGDNDIEAEYRSDEWRFSPKGPDGLPEKLFDRKTGVLNQHVLQAWQHFDIRHILERNWDVLGPLLHTHLHIVCGKEDTFFLDQPTSLFCRFLESKGEKNACELIPGRDHFDLYLPYKTYPDGLAMRFYREMRDALPPS